MKEQLHMSHAQYQSNYIYWSTDQRTWFTVIAEKLNIDTHHQAKLNDVDIHVYFILF
jgi:hypothetical protein